MRGVQPGLHHTGIVGPIGRNELCPAGFKVTQQPLLIPQSFFYFTLFLTRVVAVLLAFYYYRFLKTLLCSFILLCMLS